MDGSIVLLVLSGLGVWVFVYLLPYMERGRLTARIEVLERENKNLFEKYVELDRKARLFERHVEKHS
jgi:hypothetical protein